MSDEQFKKYERYSDFHIKSVEIETRLNNLASMISELKKSIQMKYGKISYDGAIELQSHLVEIYDEFKCIVGSIYCCEYGIDGSLSSDWKDWVELQSPTIHSHQTVRQVGTSVSTSSNRGGNELIDSHSVGTRTLAFSDLFSQSNKRVGWKSELTSMFPLGGGPIADFRLN